MNESESVTTENQIQELIDETDEVSDEDSEGDNRTPTCTPSVMVKKGNKKLKILSTKKKRVKRPSRFKESPYEPK